MMWRIRGITILIIILLKNCTVTLYQKHEKCNPKKHKQKSNCMNISVLYLLMNAIDNMQNIKQNQNFALQDALTFVYCNGQHEIDSVYRWWKPEGDKLRRFLSADADLRYTVPGLRPISLFSTCTRCTTIQTWRKRSSNDARTRHYSTGRICSSQLHITRRNALPEFYTLFRKSQ